MTRGIWRHAHLFEDGGGPAARAEERGWTLGEGDTPLEPLPDLAERLGLASLAVKREDLNPSGSHKDRGLLYQVAAHHRPGGQTFVLSSSGNAAKAAADAVRVTGDRLVAFLAPGTAPAKRSALLRRGAVVVETLKPINFARYAARVFGLLDLRGTRDAVSAVGYRSLAGELAEADPRLDAVLTFSSSGISIEGLADGFERLGAPRPALFAVQAGECLGLVRALDPETEFEPGCPAGRLGIRNPPHAAALAERLAATGGGAVAVRTEAILAARTVLEEHRIATSAEGAAVLAGAFALRERLRGKRVVAILTGAADQWPEGFGNSPPPADGPVPEPVTLGSYLETRAFFIDELGLEPL